jgi:hypothetical protein
MRRYRETGIQGKKQRLISEASDFDDFFEIPNWALAK